MVREKFGLLANQRLSWRHHGHAKRDVHIRADADTDYKNVGKVIAAINRGGLIKVGFITEPDRAMMRIQR